LPAGRPYEMIWNLLTDLQTQIRSIQLTPGPQGPRGNPGPKGDPGLACWDLNGNGACDPATEDRNSDRACTAADCQGPQGAPGQQGPAGICSACSYPASTCLPGEFVTGFDAAGNLICTDLCISIGLTRCTGTCVNLFTDPRNCGLCDTTCEAPHVSTSSCANGECIIAACETGYRDCDHEFANGCEADLSSDATCGSCTNPCILDGFPDCTPCSGGAGWHCCFTSGGTQYCQPDCYVGTG